MYKFLLPFFMLLPLTSAAELLHLPDNDSASLFQSTESYVHGHPVMAGTVLYQADSDEIYSEGYFLSKSIPFSGRRLTKVFDYDSRLSLEFILSRFSSSLRQQGYSVEYECMAIDCGEAEAFGALFGSLMDSSEGRYGYQLLSRNSRNDDMVSIYAALIDSRVRVTVELFGGSNELKYVDLRPTQIVGEFQGLTIYFDSSSSNLNSESAQLIKDFAVKLASQSVPGVLVRGHADLVGEASVNRRVSSSRAEGVHKLLTDVYGDLNCKAQSFGSARPYFHQPPARSGLTDRRAEIVVINSEESC